MHQYISEIWCFHGPIDIWARHDSCECHLHVKGDYNIDIWLANYVLFSVQFLILFVC